MTPVYDEVGRGYTVTRAPDPRLDRVIRAALGDAQSVVNVGAGSGSYEAADRTFLAVDPSLEMIRQRPRSAAPAVQAVAEHLPLRDGSVDAALAVLTVHHWSDVKAGLAELRRAVRQRVVVVTWDPAARDAFWLTAEYLPQIAEFDARRFPPLDEIARQLGDARVEPRLIPHDCRDGFLGAFWRRPQAYLLATVRQGMSGFVQLPTALLDAGLARLADDLRSGRWNARFGALNTQESVDLGYRIVIGHKPHTRT